MNMGSFGSFHSNKRGERYRKVMICGHLEKFQPKMTLKFHLELNFNNFQERKNGNVFTIFSLSRLTLLVSVSTWVVN